MDGKRKHKRFETQYKAEFSSRGLSYQGESADFSLNGLLIKTKNPFAPGTVIGIKLYLGDGLTSSLTGKVRRTMKMSAEQTGMGIEIINSDANYCRFITAYYIRHAKSLIAVRA
jgi:hypothetical protein